MKKWKKDIIINVPIEFAWPYFYGDLEKKKAIFPKIIDEEVLKETHEVEGTIIRQAYKNGSIDESYDLTIKKFINEPNHKLVQEAFILNNMFRMKVDYELNSVDENQTRFTYQSVNRPRNPLLSLFQLFGKDDVIIRFMNRTKTNIEEAYNPNGVEQDVIVTPGEIEVVPEK